MPAYFTDTMPNVQVVLGEYSKGEEGQLENEGNPQGLGTKVTWNATDLGWEGAHKWCVDNNFYVILLLGEKSITDFENQLVGNRSVLTDEGNRTSGPPVSLLPGDTCLIMHRQEPEGILRWKLIDNVALTDSTPNLKPKRGKNVDPNPNEVPDVTDVDPT